MAFSNYLLPAVPLPSYNPSSSSSSYISASPLRLSLRAKSRNPSSLSYFSSTRFTVHGIRSSFDGLEFLLINLSSKDSLEEFLTEAEAKQVLADLKGDRAPIPDGFPILFFKFSARAELQESDGSVASDAFTKFKRVLLPITDRNPYLSEGTRQAAATTTALAKKYGADITVVVIDEKPKQSIPEHDAQLSSIRWHLSEGGFQEFGLMERLGEGKKPTAIIGEVADDLNLDLVVLSMEAIH